MKKYKTVREAYENIQLRNKFIRLRAGDDEETASREGHRLAIKYAWLEFNIYNQLGEFKDVDTKEF